MPYTATRRTSSEDDYLGSLGTGASALATKASPGMTKAQTAPEKPINVYRGAMRTALDREQAAADEAVNRQANYDPYEAANRASEAQFYTVDRGLREGVEDLRGSQVGRGRLRTGFGFQDEDRLYRDTYESFGRSVAERSLQASGLELQNIHDMQRSRELAPEIAAGGIDAELARMDYESQKKGGFLGGIGGLLGAGVGFIAGGGPLGVAAGAQIGGNVFRGLFS